MREPTPKELLEQMTPDQRARYDEARDRRKKDRKDHPLAYAVLWHSDMTSQLEAIKQELSTSRLYRFLLGGNRSGKSEGGAIVDLCYALGIDHPDVASFLEFNGIDPAQTDIPEGPGVVWAIAPDSNDSRRFVRPKVAAYAPAGSKWRNRDGPGEAEVALPGGGKIVFKSVDQGRDGFQGDAVRRVRFDEEPNDPGVVSEASMRVVDYRGHLAFTMTPVDGWTSLLEKYVREPDEDTIVQRLWGEDNPHVPEDYLRLVLSKHGAHEQRARRYGEIVALEGRIYVDFMRAQHVISPQPIPPAWPRFAAVDFGTRNPTAVLWLALDPRDDVLHVYREHYQAMQTQEWHVRRYKALSGWVDDEEPEVTEEWIIADPAGTAERLTWAQHEVITIPAYKGPGSVRAGISAVAERLAPDAEGKPHLLFHSCCINTIREIENYVWRSRKTKADLPDEPEKRNDHAMDALRYAVHHLARLGDLYEEEP